MPKIIEHVRESIIIKGRKILVESSYKELSIRQIAKSCHIATGTFYNYFNSKDDLVQVIFRDDWEKAMKTIEGLKDSSLDFKQRLRIVYDCLLDFLDKYISVFHEIATLIGYDRSQCLRESSNIYALMEEIICFERKKGNIKSKLSDEKLSNLILSNFFYLCKTKYITFEELYESFYI